MELAWQLRGYAISIRVLRREEALRRVVESSDEQGVEPDPGYYQPQKAHEDFLRASGSRYVNPTL